MQFNKSMRFHIFMHSLKKLKVSISETHLFFIKVSLHYYYYKMCILNGIIKPYLRSNLKNLSHGLNQRRVSNMDWFHLKLYLLFQDLSQRSIETGFETRLKFIKFGLWSIMWKITSFFKVLNSDNVSIISLYF